MQAAYITSAKTASQIQDWEHPEVVFLGRSNCGKSSLINALLRQKNIARVSSTPGRTQMINYFSFARKKDEEIVVADLPGWGYQEAGRNKAQTWDELMGIYLARENIQDYLVLVDVRRKVEDHELEFFRGLGAKGKLIVVMTKVDKLKGNHLRNAKKDIEAAFVKAGIDVQKFIGVSSLKNIGIDELRDFLFREISSVQGD